ncbi:MAG TPA: hypothetical protein VF506_11100, partial [Streptosporangiaceae bacterium]
PAGDTCKVEVFGTKSTVSSRFLDAAGGEATFREALRLQAEDFARSVAGTRTAGTPAAGASVADAIAALRIASLAETGTSQLATSQ